MSEDNTAQGVPIWLQDAIKRYNTGKITPDVAKAVVPVSSDIPKRTFKALFPLYRLNEENVPVVLCIEMDHDVALGLLDGLQDYFADSEDAKS